MNVVCLSVPSQIFSLATYFRSWYEGTFLPAAYYDFKEHNHQLAPLWTSRLLGKGSSAHQRVLQVIWFVPRAQTLGLLWNNWELEKHSEYLPCKWAQQESYFVFIIPAFSAARTNRFLKTGQEFYLFSVGLLRADTGIILRFFLIAILVFASLIKQL